jgi:hypothetical protein
LKNARERTRQREVSAIKRLSFTLIYLVSVGGILLSARCDPQPAGPAAEDLFGTWMMSTAVMTSSVTIHTAGTGTDSTDADSTATSFTNNNDYYTYYSDMTYYTQFDDNIIGNTGMITDTGTWTFGGTTLTIVSSQSQDPYTSTLDLNGDSATITTRVFSDSQPGPSAGDYVLYHQDLAISAVKQ